MVYVMLAPGFEEVEAITTVDLLRRAEIEVKTVSIAEERLVFGAHGIALEADMLFNRHAMNHIDMIVLPGGMPGTLNLDASQEVEELLLNQNEKGGPIAAICAAPMVLGHKGILQGRRATIYPGMEEELIGASRGSERVVIDGNIITSMGPGTAMEFGLALVGYLKDEQTRESVRKGLLYEE